MVTSEERPRRAAYGRAEDACLARAAESVDFGTPTAAEEAAVAEQRVDPLRTLLVHLFSDIGLRPRR